LHKTGTRRAPHYAKEPPNGQSGALARDWPPRSIAWPAGTTERLPDDRRRLR